MKKVLIIGAGSVGTALVKKCLQQEDVFSEIYLASRRISSCQKIADSCKDKIHIRQVDADNVDELIALMQEIQPFLCINVALPYQDLTIMDACLACNVHYVDTANYEPRDEAKFCYKWQWDYQDKFKEKNLTALLGCGFDPGVTNVFCAWANKYHFDEIHKLDIIDCNDATNNQAFATNFNPEINIREITANAKFYKNGKFIEQEPLKEFKYFNFPDNIGEKKIYLLYHEELESLVKNIPSIKEARFWMTFSDSYLTHLKVLEDVGLTNIEPTVFQGQEIIPLEFLKHILPDPSTLGSETKGKTCIGCVIEGIKDNKFKKYYIYNVCHHELSYQEVGTQAVAYTTATPAMIASKLLINNIWLKAGVFNLEELDPDPFMKELNKSNLPWQETIL